MSNLSELLPTGGGQNAVEFTAAENISAGQAVALRTDGQIEAADSANQENIIGLAAEAITSGNTGNINVFGGINEAQSSLTIGSDYYVDSSGSLTTSNTKPYVAIGQAISATTINLRDNSNNYVPPEPGQTAYTTSGTYSWVAPTGITSVSAVAIGGGGYMDGSGNGGAGGGLGYKNNITVVPGDSYTVEVGSPTNGSYFVNTSTVRGGGGTSLSSKGTYTGDGGGNGGSGGNAAGQYSAGGGGAGGYSGAGGNGASYGGSGNSGNGGGGGGGGATNTLYKGGGGGGGVGIYGEGTNGSGGAIGIGGVNGYPGTGGSSGTDGTAGSGNNGGNGGTYGGGSGGGGGFSGTPSGGAVRIIWGTNRAFPSTNTGDL